MTKRIVAAFDFDGTITTRDTLLPFLKQYGLWKLTKGTCKTLAGIQRGNLRNALKENTLKALFADFPIERLEEEGRIYAETLPRLYRKETLGRIKSHKERGDQLILVTGSLGCYARPAAAALGFDHTFAVELASTLGHMTGDIQGANVRGPEKARLLKNHLKGEPVELWAYGNSSGDKEMLKMADHAKMV